jgi:hypothetical protein
MKTYMKKQGHMQMMHFPSIFAKNEKRRSNLRWLGSYKSVIKRKKEKETASLVKNR